MMQESPAGSLVALLWMFHSTFVIIAALGVLFFVVWAIKHLSAQKMKTLWIWLLVVGIAGSLVTCPILLGLRSPFAWGSSWSMHRRFDDDGSSMMKKMMDQMERDDMGTMMNDSKATTDAQEEGESY